MPGETRPTVDAQLAAAQRERRRVARERMAREVAGDRWRRMTRIIPVLFRREGELVVRRLVQPWRAAVDALRGEDAVFAHDTALRLARGRGFLTGGDVFAYVTAGAVERLAEHGVIAGEPHPDTALVRPWPGPPRLLACVVERLPEFRVVESATRVVTEERLRAELIGIVGLRPDLFALTE